MFCKAVKSSATNDAMLCHIPNSRVETSIRASNAIRMRLECLGAKLPLQAPPNISATPASSGELPRTMAAGSSTFMYCS